MILSSKAVWIVNAATIRGTLIRRQTAAGIEYALRERGTRGREIPLERAIGRALEQMIDDGAAGALARRSNRKMTDARAEAARINGRKGGRPRKTQEPDR